jgi:DNA repair exonuclease SbcCD ATPase subunit
MGFGKPTTFRLWLRGRATKRSMSLWKCAVTAAPCGWLLALFSISAAVSVAEAQTPTPSEASAAAPTPSTPEALLREYEIRLNAHRRALLQREAELEAARRQISELHRPSPPDPARVTDDREVERSKSKAREEIARLREKTRELEAQVQAATAASPTPSADPAEGGDKALIAALQRELDLERENRATLEKEMQRLASESRSPDQLQAVSQSLDGARAEILVLNHRLAEEQRAREALEVTIERVRQAAAVAPGDDWLERFQSTMNERHEQAERLQEELHKANEAIVALKGQLESAGPAGSGGGADVASVKSEVKKLKDALQTAQQANSDLRAQAEVAARLAELLYGQSR